MRELRGLAQHAEELDRLKVKVVAISVDDVPHAHDVWEKVASRKITILSDLKAEVIGKYGLVHSLGKDGHDIAIRATVLIDERGIQKWRRASQSVQDIPTFEETLADIRRAQDVKSDVDQNH